MQCILMLLSPFECSSIKFENMTDALKVMLPLDFHRMCHRYMEHKNLSPLLINKSLYFSFVNVERHTNHCFRYEDALPTTQLCSHVHHLVSANIQ